MKKLLLIGNILLLAASCDVLDVQPLNSIPAAEAFKDKAGIERGIIGAYSDFQSLSYYGRTYGIFSDLAADNLVHPPNATATEYSEVDNNSILPENASVDGIWTVLYEGINIANNVIAQVPNVPGMSDDERNVALAELYFIRALNHFNLTNYYGAIPIKTTPTIGVDKVNAPRDNVDAVYSQIITDLKFAAEYLPASSSRKIRASKQAANALLARVYLYHKEYQNAVALATEVINNGGYSLLTNYADIFASDESAESIFEIDFTALNRNRIAEYNFPLTLNGRREVAPADELITKYTTGDTRLAATITYTGTTPYVIKYDDLSTGGDNVIVIRLAEMYLIRAEATTRLGGNVSTIQSDLNAIRTRAHLSPVSATAYPDLLLAIEAENRLEFAFEGHRWFDLVRTGRAVDVLNTVTNENQTLFPIPLSEILANTSPGMTQNPGY